MDLVFVPSVAEIRYCDAGVIEMLSGNALYEPTLFGDTGEHTWIPSGNTVIILSGSFAANPFMQIRRVRACRYHVNLVE